MSADLLAVEASRGPHVIRVEKIQMSERGECIDFQDENTQQLQLSGELLDTYVFGYILSYCCEFAPARHVISRSTRMATESPTGRTNQS